MADIYPAWAQPTLTNVQMSRRAHLRWTFPAWCAVNLQAADVRRPAHAASDGGDAGAPATRTQTDK